ncbi:hypothetical protein BKA65DRAFT_520561 [Rhexocercosporidium sp. MPI-PUGE-AT-0058]|nr:hypothetical protein BKA65DRAFT_520561 [Rhexocercosporidium sp. MPI-PUGE-AT-0058]
MTATPLGFLCVSLQKPSLMKVEPGHGPELYVEKYPEALPIADTAPPLAIERGEDTLKEAQYPTASEPVVSPEKRILGLAKRRFYILALVILLIVVAAVAGGVTGTLTKKSKNRSSTALTPNPTGTAGGPNEIHIVNAVRNGSSIASVDWGDGAQYEARLYFQDSDGFIRESLYSAGKWITPPRKLVQAKAGTPIAAIIYPYRGLGIPSANVSISIYFLSNNNTITEYTFDKGSWKPGLLGTVTIRQTAAESKLSGVLLRNIQPSNQSLHRWEPYILYYQGTDYSIHELVQIYNDTASIAQWISGLGPFASDGFTDAIPYAGTPIVALAAENGYGLEVFYSGGRNELVRSKAPAISMPFNLSGDYHYVIPEGWTAYYDLQIWRWWNTTKEDGHAGAYLTVGPGINGPGNPRPANISGCTGLASKALPFGVDPTPGYTSTIPYPETPLQVFCTKDNTLWRYYNEVEDPIAHPNNYTWWGAFEEPFNVGGRGSKPIPNFSNAAVLFNNGTSGQGSCKYAVVFQDEFGLLNLWGSNCNGTGSYSDTGGSATQYTGAIVPTWIKAGE